MTYNNFWEGKTITNTFSIVEIWMLQLNLLSKVLNAHRSPFAVSDFPCVITLLSLDLKKIAKYSTCALPLSEDIKAVTGSWPVVRWRRSGPWSIVTPLAMASTNAWWKYLKKNYVSRFGLEYFYDRNICTSKLLGQKRLIRPAIRSLPPGAALYCSFVISSQCFLWIDCLSIDITWCREVFAHHLGESRSHRTRTPK